MNEVNGLRIEDGVVISYVGKEQYLTIPDGVTAIGEGAFDLNVGEGQNHVYALYPVKEGKEARNDHQYDFRKRLGVTPSLFFGTNKTYLRLPFLRIR